MVVEGRVNDDELLQTSHSPKAQRRSLSSSERLA